MFLMYGRGLFSPFPVLFIALFTVQVLRGVEAGRRSEDRLAVPVQAHRVLGVAVEPAVLVREEDVHSCLSGSAPLSLWSNRARNI